MASNFGVAARSNPGPETSLAAYGTLSRRQDGSIPNTDFLSMQSKHSNSWSCHV